MASRRISNRSRRRQHPYDTWDMQNPENWTSTKLREEIEKLGIVVSKNLPKSVLKQLYLDNRGTRNATRNDVIDNGGSGVTGDDNAVSEETASAHIRACTSTPTDLGLVQSTSAGTNANSPDQRRNLETGSVTGVNINTNDSTSQLINTFTQCMTGMQQAVATGMQQAVAQIAGLKAADINRPNGVTGSFDLAQWYSDRNSTVAPISVSAQIDRDIRTGGGVIPTGNTFDNLPSLNAPVRSSEEYFKGFRSDDFTNVDIVSQNLQRSIIEGKDVNLASLLIPNFEAPQATNVTTGGFQVSLESKPDPRLSRHLSIQQFITAFGKYRRITCTVYPEMR